MIHLPHGVEDIKLTNGSLIGIGEFMFHQKNSLMSFKPVHKKNRLHKGLGKKAAPEVM